MRHTVQLRCTLSIQDKSDTDLGPGDYHFRRYPSRTGPRSSPFALDHRGDYRRSKGQNGFHSNSDPYPAVRLIVFNPVAGAAIRIASTVKVVASAGAALKPISPNDAALTKTSIFMKSRPLVSKHSQIVFVF